MSDEMNSAHHSTPPAQVSCSALCHRKVISMAAISSRYSVALLALCMFLTLPSQAQTFTLLYSFTGGSDGGNPLAPLIRDTAGNLYGTTAAGGASNNGTVFKLDPSGAETVLHSFAGGVDGANPESGLIRDSAGDLYGTTLLGGVYGCGTLYRLAPDGVNTIRYSFKCSPDGQYPLGNLARDSAGNFYGTTRAAGAYSGGIVYSVGPTVVPEKVLHNFQGYKFKDGNQPWAGVLRDSAGNLYGTTYGGGTGMGGTLYKISPSGTETVLYNFALVLDAPVVDGNSPFGEVVMDETGNLYSTTGFGGTYNFGTVFKMDTSGVLTYLYDFTGGTDGGNPYAGLLYVGGQLVGTTQFGGNLTCGAPFGCGTVFQISSSGGTLTVLHSFAAGTDDGAFPVSAQLIKDNEGNLYGVTEAGGASGAGVVFKISLKP